MATLKVELMPGNTSPVGVIIDGRDYVVTFGPDGTALVPWAIGSRLVTDGIARDRGQVKPPLGAPPYPAVTPPWPA